MADDQFEGREQRRLDSIGAQVAGIANPLVESQAANAYRYAEIYAEMASRKRIPIDVSVKTPQGIRHLSIEVPLLLCVPMNPLQYKSVGIDYRMEVSADNGSTTKVGSKVETGVSAGWGPVSASFRAEVTVGHEIQRKSHYGSILDIKIIMETAEVPEFVAAMQDLLKIFVKGAVEKMLQEEAAADPLPLEDDPHALPEETSGSEGDGS